MFKEIIEKLEKLENSIAKGKENFNNTIVNIETDIENAENQIKEFAENIGIYYTYSVKVEKKSEIAKRTSNELGLWIEGKCSNSFHYGYMFRDQYPFAYFFFANSELKGNVIKTNSDKNKISKSITERITKEFKNGYYTIALTDEEVKTFIDIKNREEKIMQTFMKKWLN